MISLQVPPPRDVVEAIERHQKLDLLSKATTTTSKTTTLQPPQRSKPAPEPTLVAAKKLRLDISDDGGIVDVDDSEAKDEESRVASEVENILSGKVLETDLCGMQEFEEMMSTESKFLLKVRRGWLNWREQEASVPDVFQVVE